MDIYQHFRKEEHVFIDRVLSWKEQVERSYVPKLSDFLDPREQDIIGMLFGEDDADLQVRMSGGIERAERKRAIIAPFYEEVEEDAFQLVALESSYASKFADISHPDVLGAFLSMGLTREKLGDIHVGDGLMQLITAKDVATYVQMNFTRLKNVSVDLREIPQEQLMIPEQEWEEKHHTVTSLRLDAVVKEMYRLSRKEAVQAIAKGFVKVNFRVVDDAKFQLAENDILSFRQKGRGKLLRIDGQSKKGKWKITTALLK